MPKSGVYFAGRSTANVGGAVVNQAFRTTDDLRLLDTGCADLDALMVGFKDDGGIGSTEPDGFVGICSGNDAQGRVYFGPDDPRNTAIIVNGKVLRTNEHNGNGGLKSFTQTEIGLEDATMLGYKITDLFAYRNRHRFSPTHEPEGDRPEKPEYYARISKATEKPYADTKAKWDAHWEGTRLSELPGNIRRALTHAWTTELVGITAEGRKKHGDAFKGSAEYDEVKRGFNLMFGPHEEVGVPANSNHAFYYIRKYQGMDCLMFGHFVPRLYPGKTRDESGEYVSRFSNNQICHPNNYTGGTYAGLIFMKEEGCDFITDEFMQMLCNTMKATLGLGDVFERFGKTSHIPYGMHGNDFVEGLKSPWGQGRSDYGAVNLLLVTGPAAGMCAYDKSGDLEEMVRRDYTRFAKESPSKYGKQTYGATSGLLYAAAKKVAS